MIHVKQHSCSSSAELQHWAWFHAAAGFDESRPTDETGRISEGTMIHVKQSAAIRRLSFGV
jgi:hypothetical protein